MERRPRELLKTASGRKRKTADTPNTKKVTDPRRGRPEPITIYQSKDAIEDERWVYIIEMKDNGSKVYWPLYRTRGGAYVASYRTRGGTYVAIVSDARACIGC